MTSKSSANSLQNQLLKQDKKEERLKLKALRQSKKHSRKKN